MNTSENQIQDILGSLAEGLEALTKQLAKEVVSEIQLKQNQPQKEEEEYFYHKEAAAYVKLCPDTLTRRVKAGKLPVYRNGRFRVYKKSDLIKLRTNGK